MHSVAGAGARNSNSNSGGGGGGGGGLVDHDSVFTHHTRQASSFVKPSQHLHDYAPADHDNAFEDGVTTHNYAAVRSVTAPYT
jgi:hypothetical protein